MLDGAARLKELFAEASRLEHARPGDDRPRQHVRRVRLLQAGHRRRGQADHRHRGLPHARHRPARPDPGAVGRRRRERRLRRRRLHPHDHARRRRRRPAQPVPAAARWSSLEGYFYKPRADRELLNEYGKGLIATTGCPSGEVQTWLRIGDFEKACESAAEFRDIFGAENFYLELMDHGLDIETRVRAGPAAPRQAARPQAGRHQRPALHVRRRTPTRTRCCCACSPARRWPTPSGSSSTRATSTSSRPRRCASCGTARCPAPATTRWRSPRGSATTRACSPSRNLMPQFPVPDGRDRGVLAAQGGHRAACERRFPGGVPEGHAAAGRVRARRHLQDGLPRLLPGHRRPVRLRASGRASGSARAVARPPAR